MFSSKDEVDSHVKKILSFKDQHNKDRQSLMISKWYFDVKEYRTAKHYVDEFIRIQENSHEALLLKAKIHENLTEFEISSKFYERLYDLYSEKKYIIKASELLLKSEKRNELKIKKFINILEKISSTDDIYIKLKKSLSPNAIFTYTPEEITDLKNQIVSNTNDDLKLRFLRILENQNGVVNSLEELHKFMDSYPILDNNEAVKIILAIFQKFFLKSHPIQFNHYYCLVLIALIRDVKICDYDRKSYLLDLFNQLKNEKVDEKNRVLFQLFTFYMSSMSHYCAVKNKQLKKFAPAISKGYSLCYFINTVDQIYFSPSISNWLRSQISVIRSISNHIIGYNNDKKLNSKESISMLVESIWESNDNPPEITDILVGNFDIKETKIKSTIDENLQCLLQQQFNNLKLICWQLFTFNKFNSQLNRELCEYLGAIAGKLFAKVPLDVPNKKAPENISKIDLIMFLLGAVLSYQKQYKPINSCDNHLLPYPFEMWQEIRIPEVIHKWWHGVCDFTLLGKRNTSIGVLRDLLKNGLESLQLVDNQMSEIMKLQLGRSAVDCADNLDSERDLLKNRAISFYNSVLQPDKYPCSFRNLPISNTFAARGYVNRQKSFTTLPNNNNNMTGFRVNELFDTEYVSDEVVNQWKFDAVLAVVDWRLLQPIKSTADLDDLQRMIDGAQPLPGKYAELYYHKSRVYAARCSAMKSRTIPGLKFSSSEYNRLLKLAQDHAQEALNYVRELPQQQQSDMKQLIQALQKLLATYHSMDEYSIMEFSCIGETCNSNKCYNQSLVSTDFFNHSTISADQSIAIDNEKLEQLRFDFAGLSSSQEKIGSEMTFCLNRVDNLSKHFQDEFSFVNERIRIENTNQKYLFSKLSSQIEEMNANMNDLNRKTDQLALKSKIDDEKLKSFKKNIDYLCETVNELTIENNLLKNELKIMNITGNVIQPEMNKIDNMINNCFQQCFISAKLQMQPRKMIENNQYPENINNIQSKIESYQTANQNSIKEEPKCDLSKINQNKWECSTCDFVNDEEINNCPNCQRVNPNVERNPKEETPTFELDKFRVPQWRCRNCSSMNKEECRNCTKCDAANPEMVVKEIKKRDDFDLSKFSKNKWQCSTCACMNPDDLINCPACQTANPNSIKEEPKVQTTFDLSKFSKNKWECPTCACLNDDNLIKCPACQTTNPKEIKTQANFDLSKFSKNKWECPTCACMNDNNQSSCPACSYNKSSNDQNQINLPSKINENSSIKFGSSKPPSNGGGGFIFGSSKPSNTTTNSQSFVFGSTKSVETTKTPSFAVNFGTTQINQETKQQTPKISFGPNKDNQINFSFGSSVNNADLTRSWKCLCTVENKIDRTDCIACGERNNASVISQSKSESDYDSDVIIVSEPFVTDDQKARARALMLPEHFYAFENLPDNENCSDSSDVGVRSDESDEDSYDDDEDENEEEERSDENEDEYENEEKETLENKSQVQNIFSYNSKPSSAFSFNFNPTTNIWNKENTSLFGSSQNDIEPKNNNTEESIEEDPEQFDPQYQPIIALPEKIEVITGEENSECLFNQRCKLFKWTVNAWTERGIGEMKILISHSTDNKKSCRLVMRRDQVHKVCCNHSITKTCPAFIDMENQKLSVCWFAEDFSEGTELVKEKFAIKFKTEDLLNLFKNTIKELQDQM